jgi:hypothetical protein
LGHIQKPPDFHPATSGAVFAELKRARIFDVCFFASEVDSSYVTGEVLTLLGGETTAG